MPAIVEVLNLHKSYGPVKAINGVSFQVETGETFGMLGPNGAGKTTTVEIIEGLRSADAGRITVLGLDPARVPARVKERIGVQLQAPSLLPLVNVQELLDLFGSFYKNHLPVEDVIRMLALEESRRVLVKNLSGGQQQRLSVALALVNDPDIAFLDEPTTGLDPQARRNLWDVIRDMSRRGKTIFLTTHYMEEAEELCDRVAIVDHGQIIAQGSPRALIQEYFKESAIEFEMTPSPGEIIKGLPGATQVSIQGKEIVLYSAEVAVTLAALLRYPEDSHTQTSIKNLRVREATLEDVFLKLTGRRIRE
jgi:ABC-2 type transport system ATP-binding protein